MIYNWRQYLKPFGKRVVVVKTAIDLCYRFVSENPFGEHVIIYGAARSLKNDGTMEDRPWWKWKEI